MITHPHNHHDETHGQKGEERLRTKKKGRLEVGYNKNTMEHNRRLWEKNTKQAAKRKLKKAKIERRETTNKNGNNGDWKKVEKVKNICIKYKANFGL